MNTLIALFLSAMLLTPTAQAAPIILGCHFDGQNDVEFELSIDINARSIKNNILTERKYKIARYSERYIVAYLEPISTWDDGFIGEVFMLNRKTGTFHISTTAPFDPSILKMFPDETFSNNSSKGRCTRAF